MMFAHILHIHPYKRLSPFVVRRRSVQDPADEAYAKEVEFQSVCRMEWACWYVDGSSDFPFQMTIRFLISVTYDPGSRFATTPPHGMVPKPAFCSIPHETAEFVVFFARWVAGAVRKPANS